MASNGLVIVVMDSKGNAIPVRKGGTVAGSPDGVWLQVRDADDRPTGLRKDGPHSPRIHRDPRALVSHAHVPGVTNPDGTPWLEIRR